ncbi:Y-family DNA polymerase [Acholeplasma laidlawii]|uniref:Y-family DNA polymerase n=1 Tax=Acholeplasma laidlawii TaxID=2148 RepID=UPI00253F9D01|nr:damage repair protein [Acholeplasma laidlawii]
MEDLKIYQLNKTILCIDLKSFYASVECVLRGLDPFKTPLVVADKSRGGGSIVLAVSPYLKSLGVPSRCRIFELPEDLNIIYAKPQMQTYLEYSASVIGVYLDFISENDLYVYSIDEAFLDLTSYLAYYKKTDVELAQEILTRITSKLGLTATCGIGPNMLMSKLSMDIEAKKNRNNIAKWNYDDIKNHLWPVTPLSKMWGIGHRMESHLNKLGLFTIGDIANYPKEKLKRRFGVLGEELWYHTHGIDLSEIKDKYKLRTKPKSFGSGQVLFRDYNETEIMTIILEMVDDVTRRLRIAKKRSQTISLSIGYTKSVGGGFSRQVTLEQPTSSESTIYQTCLDLFDMYYEGFPIRTVGVHLSKLTDNKVYQYSLFEDADKLEKEYQLHMTMDKIKHKFGKNSVIRLSSEQEHSTAKQRNKQIGGHHV